MAKGCAEFLSPSEVCLAFFNMHSAKAKKNLTVPKEICLSNDKMQKREPMLKK